MQLGEESIYKVLELEDIWVSNSNEVFHHAQAIIAKTIMIILYFIEICLVVFQNFNEQCISINKYFTPRHAKFTFYTKNYLILILYLCTTKIIYIFYSISIYIKHVFTFVIISHVML